jgi:hypothetical protein
MTILARRAAISLALLLAACRTPPAEVEHARVAEQHAREWLALIDAGDYAASWEAAAENFQAVTSKAEWQVVAARVQGGLGAPMDRELAAAKYTTKLPWEPAGERVLIQYRILYGGRAASETLTMRHEDERWKMSGFRIRLE